MDTVIKGHMIRGKWNSSKGIKLIFMLLIAILIFLFILDIFLGSVFISPTEVLKALFQHTGTTIETIIIKFRLPKAVTALTAGIALSLSGLMMQTVFRNPIAGPHILGVSAGAGLGVAIVILGFSSFIDADSLLGLGNWLIVISAWAGAGVILLLILFISSRVRDIMIVLIIGFMLASGITAIVSILQYFSNESMLKAYIIWTMGSLGNLSSGQMKVMVLSVIAGVMMNLLIIKRLNALLLGENYARTMGLNIRTSRMLVFVCTSILAGSVTAFCGPIGFIGIAVPHLARNLFRTSDHKILIPASLLIGGSVMILTDIISQLPGSDNIIPVNSVTSLIGIPVVIWVVLHNRKNSGLL